MLRIKIQEDKLEHDFSVHVSFFIDISASPNKIHAFVYIYLYRIFAEVVFAMGNFAKIYENLWGCWLLRDLLQFSYMIFRPLHWLDILRNHLLLLNCQINSKYHELLISLYTNIKIFHSFTTMTFQFSQIICNLQISQIICDLQFSQIQFPFLDSFCEAAMVARERVIERNRKRRKQINAKDDWGGCSRGK